MRGRRLNHLGRRHSKIHMEKENPLLSALNKSVITKKAKEEMIDVHGQKYLKAWLDRIQYTKKLDDLNKDWELVVPEARERVESFIDQRLGNPEGKMVPENEIAHAVNIRLAIDTVTQNLKNAEVEFDFFEEVILLLKNNV